MWEFFFRQIIAIYEISSLAAYKFTMHYTTTPFSGMSIVVIYDLILLKMYFTIIIVVTSISSIVSYYFFFTLNLYRDSLFFSYLIVLNCSFLTYNPMFDVLNLHL